MAEELDLEAFGAGRLVNESLASASSTAAAEDLAGALNALKTHAGCLQALFTLYAVPDDPDARSDGDKMTLEQFRAFALDVKAVASGPQTLAAQHVDECFGEAAKHQGGGKGAGAKKASDSSIQLDAFLVAVLRVAARKYDIATAKQQGFAELSARLERFVDAHVYPNCAPRLETIHAELGGGVTDDSTLLMKKARRLTTQTLTSCLLRRPATKGERELDAKSLATHAKKWGLLAASSEAETDARRETITRAAYARVIVHAKQNVADARAFRPRGWPFRLDANEFERALLSLAWLLYERRVARMDAEAAEAAARAAAAPAEGEEAARGSARRTRRRTRTRRPRRMGPGRRVRRPHVRRRPRSGSHSSRTSGNSSTTSSSKPACSTKTKTRFTRRRSDRRAKPPASILIRTRHRAASRATLVPTDDSHRATRLDPRARRFVIPPSPPPPPSPRPRPRPRPPPRRPSARSRGASPRDVRRRPERPPAPHLLQRRERLLQRASPGTPRNAVSACATISACATSP